MGKEIVYCVGCGTGLYEDDFRKGRARMVNDRPTCASCAPPGEKPEPPARPKSGILPKPTPSPVAIAKPDIARARKPATGRIPLATPPSTARRPSPGPAPAESGTNPTVIVGVIVAVVTIVIILVVMAGSSNREPARSYPPPEAERPTYRPPTPPPPREKETRTSQNPGPLPPADVLRELERTVQNKRPDEILALCDKARTALKGTPQEDRLRQIEEEARFAKIEPALNRIQTLIREDPGFKRRTDVQIQISTALSAAGGRSPQLEQLTADYERRYEETAARQAETVRADAEQLTADNKLNDAIRKCDEFLATFASSAEGESIKKLRAELEAKKNK